MLTSEMMADWSAAPGFDAAAFREVHASGRQVVSVRINPGKWKDAGGLSFLLQEKIPWSSYGYYLETRPFFTFEPWLHAGVFYVQEASSMFLEQAIRQTVDLSQQLVVLDGCAAPGGKSTLIQSLLSPASVLVSNEVIRSRASILEENLVKWGGANTLVSGSDPREFAALGPLFDLVVVDAPCSGSGLFRRDPEAAAEWSPDLVKLCSQRQQRILADYWECLRPGGVLIYSTCSYSVAEDEGIADWLMEAFAAEPIVLQTDPSWQIVTVQTAGGAAAYRFYPDKLKGEGFFLAAFRKGEGHFSESRHAGGRAIGGRAHRLPWEPLKGKSLELLYPWLEEPAAFRYFQLQENAVAVLPELAALAQQLGGIYIRRAGLLLGKSTGKELVPDHALALSQHRNRRLPLLELDRPTALRYLRKEDIHPDAPARGWWLAAYAGQSLGWLKNIGNRSNNYYPREWRILKAAP